MSLTTRAPITAATTIFSGQVISLVSGAWVLGCAAGLVPHIAFADSTDTDVISSGVLLGLSCAGQFEIETGYYTAGVYNANNLPLVADTGGNAGNVNLASGWNTTSDILGETCNGGLNNFGVIAGVANSGNNSESTATSTVIFRTTWLPKRT